MNSRIPKWSVGANFIAQQMIRRETCPLTKWWCEWFVERSPRVGNDLTKPTNQSPLWGQSPMWWQDTGEGIQVEQNEESPHKN
jgi:hypothetical protein